MSHRYRAYPAPDQVEMLARHCGDARFVWNLALEQLNYWRPGRSSPPGPAERMRQLAEARQQTWLGEGSSSVQQQALRDFNQALANFFAGTHRRPTWRKKGVNEGFCVRDVVVERLNRRWARLCVPKLGRLRFRLSRPLPDVHGMARVTLDRAGRACGHTSAENRKSQAVFACVACGHTNHADLNAAANIAARGLPAPAHAPGPGVYARVSPAQLAAGTSGKAAA